MSQDSISCALYDYLEVACLYKIDVTLTFVDGTTRRGTPITLRARKGDGEYLIFLPYDQPEPVEIRLSTLQAMLAIADNPHFDHVVFQASDSVAS